MRSAKCVNGRTVDEDVDYRDLWGFLWFLTLDDGLRSYLRTSCIPLWSLSFQVLIQVFIPFAVWLENLSVTQTESYKLTWVESRGRITRDETKCSSRRPECGPRLAFISSRLSFIHAHNFLINPSQLAHPPPQLFKKPFASSFHHLLSLGEIHRANGAISLSHLPFALLAVLLREMNISSLRRRDALKFALSTCLLLRRHLCVDFASPSSLRAALHVANVTFAPCSSLSARDTVKCRRDNLFKR